MSLCLFVTAFCEEAHVRLVSHAEFRLIEVEGLNKPRSGDRI